MAEPLGQRLVLQVQFDGLTEHGQGLFDRIALTRNIQFPNQVSTG